MKTGLTSEGRSDSIDSWAIFLVGGVVLTVLIIGLFLFAITVLPGYDNNIPATPTATQEYKIPEIGMTSDEKDLCGSGEIVHTYESRGGYSLTIEYKDYNSDIGC